MINYNNDEGQSSCIEWTPKKLKFYLIYEKKIELYLQIFINYYLIQHGLIERYIDEGNINSSN